MRNTTGKYLNNENCTDKHLTLITPRSCAYLHKNTFTSIYFIIIVAGGCFSVVKVILRLHLCILVDKYRQEEQIQCVEAKFVTYVTAHLPVICWLASCVGVSRFECCLTCLIIAHSFLYV